MATDDLIIPETEIPKSRIETEDQARNFVDELIQDMTKWRAASSVKIPNPSPVTMKNLQRATWVFLNKQGRVEGALLALLLAGKISERFYMDMHQRTLNALAPTVVGHMGG